MERFKKIIAISNYILPLIILTLSLLSTSDLCMGGCSALSDYRLFGTSFVIGGSIYALLLMGTAYFTKRANKFHWLVDILVSVGLGAEIWFISIQKYVVQKWCPICLSIAATLAIFFLVRAISSGFRLSEESTPRKRLTARLRKSMLVLVGVFAGLAVAVVSVGEKKVDLNPLAKELEAATAEFTGLPNPLSRSDIWFGRKDSRVEVYFVSDWYCEFCRKSEHVVESALPELEKLARYTWIDLALHRESKNLIPFSLNMLLNNKEQYLKSRHIFFELTKDGKAVSEEKIKISLQAAGIKIPETGTGDHNVLYMDGAMFCRDGGVNQTPTAIIVDTETGRHQMLAGIDQLTTENLLKAVKGSM